MSSIFTKIIAGEIPSYKVYEDEYVFAFLDINPSRTGHTLVVPKKEVDQLFDLDDETYTHTMEGVRWVAQLLKTKLHCKRVCVVVEGYEVPHAHVHLLPTDSAEDFISRRPHKATEEELKEVHAKIVS